MIELKQIDDNTYSINGRTFKHTGEDVRSPMEHNVQDAIDFHERFNAHIATFCQGLKALGKNKLDNTQQQDEVLFVTEDGENIYPSQIFCYVPKENTVIFTEAYEVLPINFFERTKEGKLFSTEQAAQAYIDSQKPKLPTLVEVFKKVQPKWYLSEDNGIEHYGDSEVHGSIASRNQLSTKQQCEQIQAWVALRVIADGANGEAGWMPKNGGVIYGITFDLDGAALIETYDFSGVDFIVPLFVGFKQREHAEQAISILKEAGLLDALKG